MSKFSKRLRELRNAKKISQQKLAEHIGISKSSINMYERGEREPGLEVIEAFADFFDVDIDYLLAKSEIPNKSSGGIWEYANVFPLNKKRIPLLGEIACGEPIFAVEDRESYVDALTNINADFCLKAKGDSMINARILDGDIVFIQSQSMVDNGEIAAVIINDEATLKRVFYDREAGTMVLSPENPKFSPLVFSGEELNSIRILGKAIAFQSNVK